MKKARHLVIKKSGHWCKKWLYWYGYCINNPLKYTDPDGEFFFIIPHISWSPKGGLDFSLTVGFGIPKLASVQATIGYNHGNFYGCVSASSGGSTGYAGYGTKSGWFAGANYNFIPFSFNFNSNVFSIGFNYSQNGGLSGSYLGTQVSSEGVTFDPSFGAGISFSFERSYIANNPSELCEMSESCFKTRGEALDYLAVRGFEDGKYRITSYNYRDRQNWNGEQSYGGITNAVFINRKLLTLRLTMYPHRTKNGFNEAFNHELIHGYDIVKYGMSRDDSYRETKAYQYTDRYTKFRSVLPNNVPIFQGAIDMFDVPTYLIPTLPPNIPFPSVKSIRLP